MTINTKAITALFLNALFTIGVILTIAGFIQGLRFISYSVLLDKYPLASYEEDCTRFRQPLIVQEKTQPPSDQELQQQEQDCLQAVTEHRKVKQIQDATQSFGLFISGLALIFLFSPKSNFVSRLS